MGGSSADSLVRALVIALILATAGILALTAPETSASEEPACEQHPPIVIVGDRGPTGFALAGAWVTGDPLHRPGSGVQAGAGTAEDPYVIAGWCFSPPASQEQGGQTAGQAIHLLSTEAHVVIQDNVIRGEGGPADFQRGILVQEAANVTVRENDVRGTRDAALAVENSTDVVLDSNGIQGNDGAGVRLEATTATEVRENGIQQNGDGLDLVAGQADQIEANHVEANEQALVAANASGLRLTANTFQANGDGLHLVSTDAPTIQENTIRGHPGPGVELTDGQGATIEANLFEGNEEGVRAEWSDRLAFVDNLVTANDEGFVLRFAEGGAVLDNTFDDHGTATFLEGVNETRVAGNAFADHHGGLVVWESASTTVEDNRFTAGNNSMSIGRSNATLVANNTVEDHANIALALHESGQNHVADNLLRGNGDGIAIYEGADHRLRGNVIEDDDHAGLYVASLEQPVDAAGNWWGHASGPGGGAVDDCTGSLADGEGERIDLSAGAVCFDPPLTEPNPDAGAS